MSDDIWRSDDDGNRRPGRRESEMDSFDDDEFGGPLFGDTSEQPVAESGQGDSERLSFGEDTGSMPHWTEPPTGELPEIETQPPASADPTDDLDVWSSFTTESPVWKEGDEVDQPSGSIEAPTDPTGELTWEDAPAASEGDQIEADAPSEGVVSTSTREPARITIGTDPSGMPRRPDSTRRGASPQRPPGSAPEPQPDGRNLPVAIAVGLLLAAAFLALTMWRPVGSLAFVTVALGLASIEYFSKVTEKGYRPAVAVGVAACIAAPLAAY